MATKTLGPGDAYSFRFYTRNASTGVPANPDSTPTVATFRNEATDAWAPTVTNLGTGRYRVTGTIPAYAAGDRMEVEVTVVVGGITAYRVDEFRLDSLTSTRNSTTPPTVAAIRAEMDSNSTKLANLDATVSSRSTYSGGDTAGVTTLLTRIPSQLSIASGAVTVGGYASGQDPATLVWAAAARTLTTLNGIVPQSGFFANAPASSAPTAQQNADALLATVLEAGETVAQNLRIARAVLAGTENATGFVSKDGTIQRVTYSTVNGFRVVSAVIG